MKLFFLLFVSYFYHFALHANPPIKREVAGAFSYLCSGIVRKTGPFCEQHPNNTRTTPEELVKTSQKRSKPVKTSQKQSKAVNTSQRVVRK
jgi:hypothetical protein